ncbi:hypothetical protein KC368_g63 [Hortaea werneckii]|nr:hypothetical protein KC368_g63 [Hortaea werneckii]
MDPELAFEDIYRRKLQTATMDPSILVQETIRNSQCVQGAVVMEAVRPSLEKTSVKNGRFIMIGILAGINTFTYPSSSTQGETPYRKPKATIFFTPLMSRNASMLTGR